MYNVHVTKTVTVVSVYFLICVFIIKYIVGRWIATALSIQVNENSIPFQVLKLCAVEMYSISACAVHE